MDLELNSEGGSRGTTSLCSDQLFDACGAGLCWTCLTGGVVGRAQPRSSSTARGVQRSRTNSAPAFQVDHGQLGRSQAAKLQKLGKWCTVSISLMVPAKYLRLGKLACLCLLAMILKRTRGRIPRPCVVVRILLGADVFGLVRAVVPRRQRLLHG